MVRTGPDRRLALSVVMAYASSLARLVGRRLEAELGDDADQNAPDSGSLGACRSLSGPDSVSSQPTIHPLSPTMTLDVVDLTEESPVSDSVEQALPPKSHHQDGGATQQPVPHPEQLRHIVFNSDADALRDMVLELCNLSPALSRATIRCLAPHSAFAQSTLRRATLAPQADIHPGRPPAPKADADARLAARSGHRVAIKMEEGSSVHHAPQWRHAPPPLYADRPHYATAGQDSRTSAHHHDRPKCGRCRMLVDDSLRGPCRYHPGSTEMIRFDHNNRQSRLYSCCRGGVWSKGCRSAPWHLAAPSMAPEDKPFHDTRIKREPQLR